MSNECPFTGVFNIDNCVYLKMGYCSELSAAPGNSDAWCYKHIIPTYLRRSAKANLITNSYCPVCGDRQFNSPAGVTCINGHGGARGVTDPSFKED